MLIALIAIPAMLSHHQESPANKCKTGQNPSATELIRSVELAYRSLKSYSDSGSAVTKFTDANGRPQFATKLTFKTHFVRPGLFRFEYEEAGPVPGFSERMVIWSIDGKTKTWWTVKGGTEDEESIESAIGGATGVSSGTAALTPALLMPEIGWGGLDFRGLKPDGEESLEQVKCWKFSLKAKDRDVTYWIEKGTYMVRKIWERDKLDSGTLTDQTTLYDPVRNPKLTKSQFEFVPPK